MKNLLSKKIYVCLNIIFLIALTALNYKIGLLDSVLAAGHPGTHHIKKRFKHSLKPIKKNSLMSASLANRQLVVERPTPQPSPTLSQPQATATQSTDNVMSAQWWQDSIKSQVQTASNKQYEACLFGDSISSGLGNSLGDRNYNFAIGGMSTVSLLEQLQILNGANVKCRQAIIAIGTNDAMYGISNEQFTQNLKANIVGAKAMGAKKVILIPAFYSTIAASHEPSMAGTIERVNEINGLIRQVAKTENIPISSDGIKPLYEGQALKQNLTVDGVHLNEEGQTIYRQALLKLLPSSK